MADIADQAADFDFNAEALNLARTRPRETVVRDGRCLNCAEPISVGIFCDAYCREDYEQAQRIKGRLHK